MTKTKKYLTPENQTVIASFSNANVYSEIIGKPMSKITESKEAFLRKAISRQWKEIKEDKKD